VGYYDGDGSHGFVLSGCGYATPDDPNAAVGSTLANGINDAGEIVGNYSDATGVGHGFRADPLHAH
jgi:hypothetical protein